MNKMNIWGLVSFTAGVLCLTILLLVGLSIIAGLIEGIITGVNERKK